MKKHQQNLPRKSNGTQPALQQGNTPVPSSLARIPSLEDFKAMYYFMNAKPDTQIRLMQGKRKVSIDDVNRLNNEVIQKLQNHDVSGSITSINIVVDHSENKNKSKIEIRDYVSWFEFSKEKWDRINGQTVSLTVVWDLVLKLPHYEIPQRHTLKLRIGSWIPPKDMIHLVITSDDPSELAEASSDAVCKIDFINQVLATELLNIVNNWHEGLIEADKIKGFQKLLLKYKEFTVGSIHNFTPIIVLGVYVLYANLLCEKYHLNENLKLSNFNWVLWSFVAVFFVGSMAGKVFARWYNRITNKYKEHSEFVITKGDEKAQLSIKSNNDETTKKIIIRLILFVITVSISALAEIWFEKILSGK